MATSKRQFTTIDGYIDSFPAEVQERLQTLRQTIREAAPEAEETISYNMPTFTLYGYLVYFAAFKQHFSLYPASDDMEAAIPGLSPYRAGKGTLQLPLDQPLPLPLIRQFVQFQVEKNRAQAARKP